jgi:hypothetical protein
MSCGKSVSKLVMSPPGCYPKEVNPRPFFYLFIFIIVFYIENNLEGKDWKK